MLPDRVLNPGPLTDESGALPIALRGPARKQESYTVEFRWLDHLGNYENMLETGVIRTNEC